MHGSVATGTALTVIIDRWTRSLHPGTLRPSVELEQRVVMWGAPSWRGTWWERGGMTMPRLFNVATMTAWCLLSACGDNGGASASAGSTGVGPDATDTTATGATTSTATTAPTTTAPTEGGSNSASASESTAGSDASSDTQSSSSASGTTTTGDSATVADASSGDTTDGVSASDGSSGPGTTSTTGPGTSTGPDTGTGTDTGEPPCEPGAVGEEFSFAWIANTDQGSVSKINTDTMVEMARYYTDPVQSGAASPSRTSVSLDGRFVVVSNRDTGSITKIAANEADCVDKNNDGMIQTSKDKAQLLPYAQEECIAVGDSREDLEVAEDERL